MSDSSSKVLAAISSAALIWVSASVSAETLSLESISSAQLDEIVREQEHARYTRQSQNRIRLVQETDVSSAAEQQRTRQQEMEQKRYRVHTASGNWRSATAAGSGVLAVGTGSPTMKSKGSRSGGGRK